MEHLKFKPARLIISQSGWRIVFYVRSPYTDKLERITYKVNQFRKDCLSNKIAKKELENRVIIINSKLLDGWSPFIEEKSINSIKTIIEAIEDFMLAKKREIRQSSFVAYGGMRNRFIEYLKLKSLDKMSITKFSKYNAIDYLDYLTKSRVSAMTWNNYKGFLVIVWNWLIERDYCIVNVFDKIKPKRTEVKARTIIPKNDRERIETYVLEHYPNFFVFMILEYACLMRPIEIFRSKVCNYDLEKRVINLDYTQTKNKKARSIIIPNSIFNMVKSHFDRLKLTSNDKRYLFSVDFLPSNIAKTAVYAGDYWRRNVQKTLNLPKNYHLYSLRDTGIMDMLDSGINPNAVKYHADHSSLATTTRYANHLTEKMKSDLQNLIPKF